MTQSNPALAAPGTATLSVKERVQRVIEWIRPIIQSDGGDLELVDVTDAGVVSVRFHGACVGCPSSTATLRMGIERNIKEKVPEVTQVVPVGE
jgi:Fe-S cluster biogenesis protein NfuA